MISNYRTAPWLRSTNSRLTTAFATSLGLLYAGCGGDGLSQRPSGPAPSSSETPTTPVTTSEPTTTSPASSSSTTSSNSSTTSTSSNSTTSTTSSSSSTSTSSTTPTSSTIESSDSSPPASTDSVASSETLDSSASETSASSAAVSEPTTEDNDTQGPTGLPVANGACAANTGLGKGSSTEYPCAALEDGGAACFTEATATLLKYQGGSAVTDAVVATGNGFSNSGCLINTEGAVHCWDNADVSTTPVIASGALELTGGQGKNCALVEGSPRTVKCWTGPSGAPATVSLSGEPTMVSCGYTDCCAVTTAGAIQCWTSPSGAAATVAAAFEASWVGTGQVEKCTVDEGGAAYCWGENWNGQLGLPNMTAQATPVTATFESGVVATASGQFHSCFLFADGTVQCSGGGQVNGAGGGENTPTVISGISNAVAISVGKHASCAALADGQVKCWGDNSGGPTPVTITASGTPIRVRIPDACK